MSTRTGEKRGRRALKEWRGEGREGERKEEQERKKEEDGGEESDG